MDGILLFCKPIKSQINEIRRFHTITSQIFFYTHHLFFYSDISMINLGHGKRGRKRGLIYIDNVFGISSPGPCHRSNQTSLLKGNCFSVDATKAHESSEHYFHLASINDLFTCIYKILECTVNGVVMLGKKYSFVSFSKLKKKINGKGCKANKDGICSTKGVYIK